VVLSYPSMRHDIMTPLAVEDVVLKKRVCFAIVSKEMLKVLEVPLFCIYLTLDEE
jgi:hypothetical protein